jgi:hypothetical protein
VKTLGDPPDEFVSCCGSCCPINSAMLVLNATTTISLKMYFTGLFGSDDNFSSANFTMKYIIEMQTVVAKIDVILNLIILIINIINHY